MGSVKGQRRLRVPAVGRPLPHLVDDARPATLLKGSSMTSITTELPAKLAQMVSATTATREAGSTLTRQRRDRSEAPWPCSRMALPSRRHRRCLALARQSGGPERGSIGCAIRKSAACADRSGVEPLHATNQVHDCLRGNHQVEHARGLLLAFLWLECASVRVSSVLTTLPR
jgi:hypothetical protein